MKQSTSILRGLTNIRASYILESEIPDAASTVALMREAAYERSARGRWKRITSSGWFVAAVCALVAGSTLAGIIWAGHNAPGTVDPVGSSDDTTEAVETESEPETEAVSVPWDENTVSCMYEFFLDKTNLNGSPIGPSETDEYGGVIYGYDDPAKIPQTDRSDLYGTTYRIWLATHKDKHRFCFRYDTNTRRLEVVIPESRIPLLLIFHVEGTADGPEIARIAEACEPLSATLLYARNIDNGRATALQGAFSHLEDQPNSTSMISRTGYIVGYALADGTYMRSTWGDHDTSWWMDEIISLYGEKTT